MYYNRIKEAIADIAYYAGYKKFTTGDSRNDVSLFIAWAAEFEKLNTNTDSGICDYINEIEEFTKKQIKAC
jgi:hypothetical protein